MIKNMIEIEARMAAVFYTVIRQSTHAEGAAAITAAWVRTRFGGQPMGAEDRAQFLRDIDESTAR